MKEIDKDYIRCYVNDGLGRFYKKPGTLWMLFCFCVIILFPSLFWGVYAEITRWLIPGIVILAIWLVKITGDIKNNKVSCILFLSVWALCTYIGCFIGIYKILAAIVTVPIIIGIGLVVVSGTILYFVIKHFLKKIRKGYYCTVGQKFHSNSLITSIASYLFAAGLVRAIKPYIGQNGLLVMIAACLLFFAIFSLVGMGRYGLKYLLIRKFLSVEDGVDKWSPSR